MACGLQRPYKFIYAAEIWTLECWFWLTIFYLLIHSQMQAYPRKEEIYLLESCGGRNQPRRRNMFEKDDQLWFEFIEIIWIFK